MYITSFPPPPLPPAPLSSLGLHLSHVSKYSLDPFSVLPAALSDRGPLYSGKSPGFDVRINAGWRHSSLLRLFLIYVDNSYGMRGKEGVGSQPVGLKMNSRIAGFEMTDRADLAGSVSLCHSDGKWVSSISVLKNTPRDGRDSR
jgi:hypothetical protein